MKVKIFNVVSTIGPDGIAYFPECAEPDMDSFMSEVDVKHVSQSSASVGIDENGYKRFATCFTVWFEPLEGAEVQKKIPEVPKARTYEDILNSPSKDLGFSTRVVRSLITNAGLKTVRDICRKSPSELLKYRNFGKVCLREVQAKLPAGLELGMADA